MSLKLAPPFCRNEKKMVVLDCARLVLTSLSMVRYLVVVRGLTRKSPGAKSVPRGRKTSIKNPGRSGSSSLAGNLSRGRKTPKPNPVKATLLTNHFMDF